MKLYPLVFAFVGAGLATVNAIPLRVTIVSSTNQIGPASNFFDNLSPPVRGEDGLYRIQVSPPVEPRRRPCHSMNMGAIDLANRFRKLFGFEIIDHPNVLSVDGVVAMPDTPVPGDETVNIMPFPPIPDENVNAQPIHRHSHHHHHRLQKASFIERLSHALMLLGPWEGRAVAFVLGCGIGVVLRMIYVLTVVSYRVFRGPVPPGEDDVDDEETTVLLIAAPPEYIKDEKVAL